MTLKEMRFQTEVLNLIYTRIEQAHKMHDEAMAANDSYGAILHSVRASAYEGLKAEIKAIG